MCKYCLLVGILGLVLGDQHSMILRQDGSVWSTAITVHGDAIPAYGVNAAFLKVMSSGAIAAAAGIGFSIVLKQDGSV